MKLTSIILLAFVSFPNGLSSQCYNNLSKNKNILFAGIQNPISLTDSFKKHKALFLLSDNGKINLDNGSYFINELHCGNATIAIYKKSKLKRIKLTDVEFNVI